jgi:hypothetical protein
MVVEHHLNRMDGVSIRDESSAYAALAQAMVAVGAINQGFSAQPEQMDRLTTPVDGIIEKLEDWIKRLLNKLTEIVKSLAKGTSFSLSVGTGVSVTINFPPTGQA